MKNMKMKNIKNMKMKNIKGSCFCLLLLTIVIIYLAVKPEGFKEGHDIRYRHHHSDPGHYDVCGNEIIHDISHNHIKYVYIERPEKEKEKEKEIKPINQTIGLTQLPLTTTTTQDPLPQNIFDWFDLNQFTNAHLAMFAVVFVLFIIIMFIIIKLTQPQPQSQVL
jgi:hypothetical protein